MSVNGINYLTKPAASFDPSFSTKLLSSLVAPRSLGSLIAGGVALMAGGTLPFCVAAGGAYAAAHNLFIRIVGGGNPMRSAVFSEADHLSRMEIQGGLPFVTLPPMLKALERMSTANAAAAKNVLEGVLRYENCFNYLGINNSFLIDDFIRTVGNLKPGQKLGMPLSNMNLWGSCHIIIGSIERDPNGTFLLRIHNAGDGLEFHYERYEKETRRKLHQTTLEIADIAMPELEQFIRTAASNQSFRWGNSVERLYRSIPALKGRILPPSSDERLWMRSQMGNSCSSYSIKCFYRSILSEEEYRTFKILYLSEAVSSIRKDLLSGPYYTKTKEHQVAYDELRSKLARYGGHDPGPVVVSSSFLSNAASKIQKKFWDFFFPLNFVSASSLRLGLDSFSFHRVGKHPEYREMMVPFEEAEIKRGGRLPGEAEALDRFKIAFESVYRKLNLSLFSTQERKLLERIREGLMRQPESYLLDQFFEITFSKKKKELTDPGAQKLMEVISHLKNNLLGPARECLEKFTRLNQGSTWTKEQKEQYEFVLCQILYIPDSIILEDMDVRAGIAIAFLEQEIDVHEYLQRNLDFYRDLRLDKVFPNSPWAHDIKRYLAQKAIVRYKQEPSRSHFDPQTPQDLKSLLQNPSGGPRS